MALSEDVLEEIFFLHPEEFFPKRSLRRYARQLALGPRSGGSRIDVAFQDEADAAIWLFEIKAANKMTSEVVTQVQRYASEVERLQASRCECPFPASPTLGVVAPVVPLEVRALLDASGIAWHEFDESQFVAVANRYDIPLSLASVPSLRLDYWRALSDHLTRVRGVLPGLRAADVNGINVLSTDGIQLTFRCSTQHNCLDVDLTFGARSAHLFPKFCERRAEIDQALGQLALWFKQGSERHIRVQRWANVRERPHWAQFHLWMQEQGEILLRWMRTVIRGA